MSQNRSDCNLRTAVDYLAKAMPSSDKSYPNPIETLSIEDIDYLQSYLGEIKNRKINPHFNNETRFNTVTNEPNRISNSINYEPNRISNSINYEPNRSSISTRTGNRVPYRNPYSYGAAQNSLPNADREVYTGSYVNDPALLNQMGVMNGFDSNGHIRDINVESILQQQETTHLPGQKGLTQKQFDRFETLPFDPQNHNRLVWADNMPRGGYPTRGDRCGVGHK